MSWHFSRAVAVEFLEASFSDGELYVLLRTTPTQSGFLSPDRMMDFSRLSQFGMTFAPLRATIGEDVLTWCLADSRVRRGVQQPEEETRQQACGLKCLELWGKYAPGLFSAKTWTKAQSLKLRQTLPCADTRLGVSWSERETLAQTILGKDGGWLATPTTKANWAAASMQKHQCCRRSVAVFGRPTTLIHEYLMGVPLGWTDLGASGTGRFHRWWQRHMKS
jgi:hypothetical protein